MYRYQRFTPEHLYVLLLLALVLGITLPYVENPKVLAFLGPRFSSPLDIVDYLNDNGVYSYGSIGFCMNHPDECDLMIRQGKKFSGVCSDFSTMFAYYYMKAGFGNPIIIEENSALGPHWKAVWLDEKFGIFRTFWDVPNETLIRFDYASLMNPALRDLPQKASPSDRKCLELIREVGLPPHNGESIEDYLKRKYYAVITVGNYTYVKLQLGQELRVEGPCEAEWTSTCPLTSGGTVKVKGLAAGVCNVSGYLILVKS